MSSFTEQVKFSLDNPFKEELIKVAKTIAAPGKGILAADESTNTIGSRFSDIKVENTLENRRCYRELLFTTPDLSKGVSGVILFEETTKQTTKEGKPFLSLLKEQGIFTGIKLDMGTKQLPFSSPGQKYSLGFEHLDQRAATFYEQGVRFAKWRSVLKLEERGLDEVSMQNTAREQALYAAICQRNGLVPIVEPELLTDGSHSREECQFATEKILSRVFYELNRFNVCLEGCLLKPSMVLSGVDHESRRTESLKDRIERDSLATLHCLLRTVPPALAGITFLSGGQSEEEASLHLNQINVLGSMVKGGLPWSVSFSFGRALQASTLKVWKGLEANVPTAQNTLRERVMRNSMAQQGKLEIDWTKVQLGEDLFVKNYTY